MRLSGVSILDADRGPSPQVGRRRRMDALIESGRIADLILLVMAVEAIVLALVHRRTGHGIDPGSLWANLCAGACLVLALRAALAGAGSGVVAAWLALGLVGHLVDLAMRWPRGGPRQQP
jgi:hypothetical protein